MADRSRADSRRLAARLRREARRGRPAFSAALHERVVAALAPPGPAPAARRGVAWRPAAVGGLVAAACAALVGAASRPWQAPPAMPDAAAVAGVELPGIERLPTPAEIGAGVLAEVTTLAADAVGLPAWSDLAALDPTLIAPADDAGR